MTRLLFTAGLLLSACLLSGCATEEPGMRAGIQDPIARHRESSLWESALQFPAKIGRTIVHAADGRTTPDNDSL